MKKLYALVVLGLFVGINASHFSYEKNLSKYQMPDERDQKAARRRARAEKRNRANVSNVRYSGQDYSGNTDLSRYTFDTEEGNEEEENTD